MKAYSKPIKYLLLSLLVSPLVALADSKSPQNQEPVTQEQTAAKPPWYSPKSLFESNLPDNVQIHGFASQSYLYTTANNYFGHTNNMGSLDFTEMGINGSWRPLPKLQTSLQIVYRRAGKTDDSYVRIDFGFLDYTFYSDADHMFGVRLGRVFNPYGLYNDTRDMPFTRPSILLPQSIYFDINRNFALSGDGIQLYAEKRFSFGDFNLQVNGIFPRTNDPSLVKAISYPFSGNLDPEPSYMARLMYDWESGRLRIGITSGDINAKYSPNQALLNWNPGNFGFTPLLFSFQYNDELWSITSEYAIRKTEFSGFSNAVMNYPYNVLNGTGESYYVQGSYRLTNFIEGFVRYDCLIWNNSDRNGQKYQAVTGAPAYTRFAKDITSGIRWDITSNVMARIEYHYINGTGWISALENTNPINSDQHWHMVGAALNFRF